VSKREKPFNNPFASLPRSPAAKGSLDGKIKQQAEPAPPRAEVPALSLPKGACPELAEGACPELVEGEDEAALFRNMVGEVVPVRGAPRLPAAAPEVDLNRITDPDAEALAQLNALVENDGPIDLSDSDEYIEGAIPSFDRKTLRKLRAGDFAVQAHLDLHGLTREEAKDALFAFLEDSRRRARRLVLVVHGRGIHSKDQIPVLKESLRVWLSQGRIGKQVLAFATARPCDGGAGALYLMLRR
jgi:DNA-nicking Smr family endonuclease